MSGRIDLLAIGTPTWETAALVQALPPGDRADLEGIGPIVDGALRVVQGGGGSAANVAVAVARAGMASSFAGVVGDDPEGRQCVEALLQAGVRTRVDLLPGRRTKRSVLLVEAGSGRVQFRVEVPPGAVPPMAPGSLEDGLLQQAAWLHLDRVMAGAPAMLERRGDRPCSLDLHDVPLRPRARRRLREMLPRLALLQVREEALTGVDRLLAGEEAAVANENGTPPAAGLSRDLQDDEVAGDRKSVV